MNKNRLKTLKEGKREQGPVAYWMSRDQRVRDNWALLWAQDTALEHQSPLVVIFCLVPAFLNASFRQYIFMLKGLEETERNLATFNIPFYLLSGSPERVIPDWLKVHNIRTLVTDFDPLKIKRFWKQSISERIHIPFYEVDTHNIVPCWVSSQKQEYGAYTIRPKIHRALKEYLEEFPPLKKHPTPWKKEVPKIDWREVRQSLTMLHSVPEVHWLNPGEGAAHSALDTFIEERLSEYRASQNDPTKEGQSNLSPYLHFGQLSAQRVALEVTKADVEKPTKEVFLEELIVRRELADNFCFYNQHYDNFKGFPQWARETLDKHRGDPRPYLYTCDQFERAETHDALWNAAQREMVKRGKMHGYMRMYWAKKILEWTESPETALEISIHLNDRYELDGRDPNGYTGIAWSIGGIHDRPWQERPVFGKIRYMSYNGLRAKFNVKRYIEHIHT